MNKKLISVLLCVVLMLSLCIAAYADDAGFVYDEAMLLDDAVRLEGIARDIYTESGIAFCFFSSRNIQDISPRDYAIQRTDELGFTNSVCLIVDAENGYYDIYVSGTAEILNDNGGYDDLDRAFINSASWQGGAEAVVKTGVERIPALILLDWEAIDSANPASALNSSVCVFDDAGVLSYRVTELDVRAAEISAKNQCSVVFLYTDTLAGKDAQAYADDYFDYNGFGYGANRSGIILMVCPSSREYAFSCRGEAIDIFGRDYIEYIENDVLMCLKAEEWFDAADIFINDCEEILTGRLVIETQKEPFSLLSIPVSLIFGFLAAFVPVKSMKAQLKSVKAENSAYEYIKPDSFALTASNNSFLTKTVSRRRIERNDSGGSQTHISSSGATHSGKSGKF